MRRRVRIVAVSLMAAGVLASGVAGLVPAQGQPAGSPFPDVPPWHWAHDSVGKLQGAGIVVGYPAPPQELVGIAITQVYDAFAHASAPAAQAWAERFTYNRPADWPSPLQRAGVLTFSLTRMHAVVTGAAATATYAASVALRTGRTLTAVMRVQLRLNGDDWQVDYATLAGGSPLFR